MLPHHQNTGGFFIAVMIKKQQLPWLKMDDPIHNGKLSRGYKNFIDIAVSGNGIR